MFSILLVTLDLYDHSLLPAFHCPWLPVTVQDQHVLIHIYYKPVTALARSVYAGILYKTTLIQTYML